MKDVQIRNAMEIIATATSRRISLTEASLTKGYGKNYVSNVKRNLDTRVSSKKVTKTEATAFKKAIKAYSSTR